LFSARAATQASSAASLKTGGPQISRRSTFDPLLRQRRAELLYRNELHLKLPDRQSG